MRIAIFGLAFIINVIVHLSLAAAIGTTPAQGDVALLAAGLALFAVFVPQLDRMMREGAVQPAELVE
jgi:hypothetical protein